MTDQTRITFDTLPTLQAMLGPHSCNLRHLAELLDTRISHRGNTILVESSDQDKRQQTIDSLKALYACAEKNADVDRSDVKRIAQTFRQTTHDPEKLARTVIQLPFFGKHHTVKPKSLGQSLYLKNMQEYDLTFALGPAGTGKSYLAIAYGTSMLLQGKVNRLILARPAVEAGERLGFLPGAIKEKIDPYLRPLYDALHDMLPSDIILKKLESQEIEIAPLAYMRGRTLSRSFIIVDEGQNLTKTQMKMLLTRLGEGSQMVVTGDPSQVDLPQPLSSGLSHAQRILAPLSEIAICKLGTDDIVRHSLVSKIVQAYAKETREDNTDAS